MSRLWLKQGPAKLTINEVKKPLRNFSSENISSELAALQAEGAAEQTFRINTRKRQVEEWSVQTPTRLMPLGWDLLLLLLGEAEKILQPTWCDFQVSLICREKEKVVKDSVPQKTVLNLTIAETALARLDLRNPPPKHPENLALTDDDMEGLGPIRAKKLLSPNPPRLRG
jgi:type VI protein secretion system component VasA